MGKKKYISITIETKSKSVTLPAKAITEGSVLLSIKTRRGGSNKRTRGGKVLVNANAFQSATLTLKDTNQLSIIDYMPLEYIEHQSFNANADGITVNRSDIDWNTSTIDFQDEAAIVNTEVVELLLETEI